MKIALVITALTTCFFCSSTMSAQEGAAGPGVTEKSVSYYLPKTAFRFALKVEGKTFHPGPYCKYTQKYYNMQPDSMEVTTYNVVNLGLTSIGVPDTTHLYTISLLGKNKGADVLLSPEGQLLAFNDEPTKVEVQPPFVPSAKLPPVDLKGYLPPSILEIEKESDQVEQAVRYMIKLRENLQHLRNGEPVDSTCTETEEQLKEKCDLLEKLFFGTTTCDTTEQVIVVVPDKEITEEVIFRLNKKTGIVSQTATEGTPYRLTVKDMHSTPKQPSELSKENKKGCVYVRVPSRIRATVFRDKSVMGTFDLYAGQFGFIEELSGSLFRNYVTHFRLSPVIGSVDRIRSDIK